MRFINRPLSVWQDSVRISRSWTLMTENFDLCWQPQISCWRRLWTGRERESFDHPPIAFKQGTNEVNLLPEPRLLIGSSLRRWNESMSGLIDLDNLTEEFDGVRIREYKLRTHRFISSATRTLNPRRNMSWKALSVTLSMTWKPVWEGLDRGQCPCDISVCLWKRGKNHLGNGWVAKTAK